MSADNNALTLRNLTLSDVPAMMRLAAQSFIELGRLPSRFAGALIPKLQQFPDWQWGAYLDDTLAGFIVGSPAETVGFQSYPTLSGPAATISWIAVDSTVKGRRVGRTLLEHFERFCHGIGYPVMIIGTPFAKGFYEKCGYTTLRPVTRLVRDILGIPVAPPSAGTARMLDIEDINTLLEKLPAEEHLKFLTAWAGVYETEPDKVLAIEENGELLAVVAAPTDPYCYDLMRTTYLWVASEQAAALAVEHLLYLVSKRGKRYAGLDCGRNDTLIAAGQQGGFVPSELPSFWMQYWLEKSLEDV